jgi:hypothetical protein
MNPWGGDEPRPYGLGRFSQTSTQVSLRGCGRRRVGEQAEERGDDAEAAIIVSLFNEVTGERGVVPQRPAW